MVNEFVAGGMAYVSQTIRYPSDAIRVYVDQVSVGKKDQWKKVYKLAGTNWGDEYDYVDIVSETDTEITLIISYNLFPVLCKVKK